MDNGLIALIFEESMFNSSPYIPSHQDTTEPHTLCVRAETVSVANKPCSIPQHQLVAMQQYVLGQAFGLELVNYP